VIEASHPRRAPPARARVPAALAPRSRARSLWRAHAPGRSPEVATARRSGG